MAERETEVEEAEAAEAIESIEAETAAGEPADAALAEDEPAEASEPEVPSLDGEAPEALEVAAETEAPAAAGEPAEPEAPELEPEEVHIPSTDRAEMEAVLESVLFVAAEPVARGRLLELFGEADRAEAEQALEAVLARYPGNEGRGVMAEEVAGGLRLVTRPELVGWLRRFFEVSGGSKLSMAALETLAIVAYRQPVTGPEIQELRGVTSSGVLSTLLQRRLVRIAGRKEVVGKPFLYATTREFLVHFGLKSLKDLPPLEEFEESFGEAAGILGAGMALSPEGDREEHILLEAAALEESAALERDALEESEDDAAAPPPALPADPPAAAPASEPDLVEAFDDTEAEHHE